MELSRLILDPTVPLSEVARHLDALEPAARKAALSRTTRAVQRALYIKAREGRPTSLADLVPATSPTLTEVIHAGRNTLPLLPSWRFFEKRFARPADGSNRLYGYNEGPTRKLVGPGYFVAVPTAGNAAWEERGAIMIDYFQVPDGPVPTGWPKVVPNSHGVQVLVYNGTRDFMRQVSEGVSIGAAYKGEKALDHYFTLVRLS